MTILGIYLALGLPIALSLVLTNADSPVIRRVLFALSMLPVWPLWGIGLVVVFFVKMRFVWVCPYCREPTLFIERSKAHVLKCPQHPYRKWLATLGFEVTYREDGHQVLRGHGRIFVPEREG